MLAEGLALAFILLLVGALRIRLLGVPLERDEGDYALGGLTLLQGNRLYLDFYTMRLPGIYLAYAGILALFGHAIAAIHLSLLLMHALTGALIYVIGKRLYGPIGRLGAAGCFGILSSLGVFLGHAANSEHFINFYAAIALVTIMTPRSLRYWQCILAGTLMGAALITEQHAAALVLIGWIPVWMGDADVRSRGIRAGIRRSAAYFTGVAIPVAFTAVLVMVWGVYAPFKRWAIDYAGAYAKGLPADQAIDNLRYQLAATMQIAGPLVVLSLAGLAVAALDPKRRRAFAVVISYLAATTLMISVGFYFRPHYFLLACPPLAIFAGKGLDSICARIKHPVWAPLCGILVFALSAGYSITKERSYFFTLPPNLVSRALYGENPFPESEAIATYVAERTSTEDRILILGSEPQINFYAGRRNATAHPHMYPLMEDQPFAAEMQDELIRQVEAAEPKYIVFVSAGMSWLRTVKSPGRIFAWIDDYKRKYYITEAVVDLPVVGLDTGTIRPFVANMPGPGEGSRVVILKRVER